MQLAFNKKAGGSGPAQKNIRTYKIAMQKAQRWKIFARAFSFASLTLVFGLSGCVTPKTVDTGAILNAQRDEKAGSELLKRFEKESQIREDLQVCRYLEELAGALIRNSSQLKNRPVQVGILKDRGERWLNYGFPGSRVYLSRSMLRNVKFENELAAAMALELAHVEKRDLLSKYESLPMLQGTVADSGIFDFSVEARLRALESSMEMMYQAGFDPRGMVLLLNHYKEKPSISPFDAKVTDQLMENSWRIIALHAPLRNPIVRSDRFLAVYQRMKKL
jgi:predicted Zn-dependent protease